MTEFSSESSQSSSCAAVDKVPSDGWPQNIITLEDDLEDKTVVDDFMGSNKDTEE
jgi:hypothetical protein